MATTQANTNAGNSAIKSPVTERASEAAHHAVDAMAEKAATAEDSLRRTAASSKATIDQKQEELKMQMQSTFERSKQFAQENPIAAAGIAFAAGMLVSALLRRN
ncbi:DUF883 domain-containing protein [Arsukibacterium sp.]|uniref:DUF883 domain-containing protein n=1 Tax=Arsukibacterium sp. TaxID=1977258 RepID=UPI002FDA62FA